MNRFIIIFFLCFLGIFELQAQVPELPNLKIETLKGNNIIQWKSSYKNIKTVNVQRLSSGAVNWVTLGIINRPRVGKKSFTDKETVIGKSQYRLKIIFQGDVDWYSNTYTVNLTAEMLAQSGSSVINSGSSDVTEYDAGTDIAKATEEETKPYTDFYYEPSTQVYTNPYTGHINITLGDARQKRYSLKFFDPNKKEVLEISRVKNTNIILDKFNFNATGIYFFQLYDADDLVETGYVTVY